MKNFKLIIAMFVMMLGMFTASGFAVELNSGNVTQPPFNCNINDTICLLGYNSITSIASGTFSNHTDLEVLRLNNNQLTGIDVGDFYGLNNITELLLDNNNISSIESGSFSMNGLLQLNLGNNEILNVSDWIGSVPSNMTHLWLNNNNIQNVGGGIFDRFTNLTALSLTYNQIDGVAAVDFSNLSNLSLLTLSENMICSIEEGSFIGLNNISQIWMHNNYLTVGEVDSVTADILDNNEPAPYYNFPDWRESQTPDLCPADPEYFDINVGPLYQDSISGGIVDFNISANSTTGNDVFVQQEFPVEIQYTDANITPFNNSALMLGFETNPRWLLSSGETLNLQIQGEVLTNNFDVLNVYTNVVDEYDLTYIYTGTYVEIFDIGDLVVQKTLISDEPQLTGDEVTYSILIQNIGSDVVTGVDLVDAWPDTVLTFSQYGFVDGVFQLPTIYNSTANNYLFEIGNVDVDQIVELIITGSMDVMQNAGQEFTNTAFALTDTVQYSTGNDTSSITNYVRGLVDIAVAVNQISVDPSLAGDYIVYQIDYQNIGSEEASGVVLTDILPDIFYFESASVDPTTNSFGILTWDLGNLTGGYQGSIVITGTLLAGAQVGQTFVNQVNIDTESVESNLDNNQDTATGTVLVVSDVDMQFFVTNLTDDSRNIDTGSNILAISGDILLFEIILDNGGNSIHTGSVSISNLNGLVGFSGQTQWNVSMWPQTINNITFTALVGPQNFVYFEPTVNFDTMSGLMSASVRVDEPLACGDGLITQMEECDTNGQIGDMLPGQYCENQNGSCVVVTNDILNTVCINYVTSIGNGEQCTSVLTPYGDAGQCEDISSNNSVVIVDEDGEGEMTFTCSTVNNTVASEIKIDCGNGDIGIANNTNNFEYTCEYEYENGDEDDNTYEVSCLVDNTTNDDCQKTILVGEGFYGVCGDGELDDGEECDYYGDEYESKRIDRYLNDRGDLERSGNDEGKICKACKIRDDNNVYTYDPPQCLSVNTTISVMEDEVMPFWWRLWDRENLKITNDSDYCDDIDYEDEDRTIIKRNSMECTFKVYDGKSYQQEDENEIGEFTIDCFEDEYEDAEIFEYFETNYYIDFDNYAGQWVSKVKEGSDDDGEFLFREDIEKYGEYKLVLDKVEFDYCDPYTQNWEEGRLYEGICEVNFTLTRPYIMQVSTFGIDPIATDADNFLEDFYDMEGERLIDSSDINQTLDVDADDYNVDSQVITEKEKFENKYKPLALTVDNNFELGNGKTVGDLFNNGIVKKVPNQMIFFVDGVGDLELAQLTNYFPNPFTIYVEGMDVKIKGSVMTNGMIITDKEIHFEDEGTDGACQEGGQVVQGIFIAEGGFDADQELWNQDEDDQWCQWGNLWVKGVLIGGGLDDLTEKKRSHLNEWFNSIHGEDEDLLMRERRREIMEGAAVLIEYNPDLWDHMPPGAEAFTESLDVYRK